MKSMGSKETRGCNIILLIRLSAGGRETGKVALESSINNYGQS